MTVLIETAIPVVRYNGLATNTVVDFSGSSSVALPANTTIAGTTAAGTSTITSTSANALTVGRQGATDPVLKINASASTVATGVSITGAAAASGVAVAAISSGTDENITINAKGAGTMSLQSTATGNLILNNGLVAETQALSGAGAVSIATGVTKVTSTGANALTLADGVDGQLKFIVMVVDGGDATLTPTTKTGYSTIVFNDAGDGVGLIFTTTQGWIVFANNGATIS